MAAVERALQFAPGDNLALQTKFLILSHSGKLSEAKQLAQDAAKLFPRERFFADAVGSVYFAQHDFKAAEQAFRLSLKLEPDTVFVYANLNAALTAQGRNDEALQILQQGLQVYPNAMLYTNLGNALFVKGDYVNAANAFENAVSKEKGDPADYRGWANLGDVLLWLPSRREEARQAYEKARDLLTPLLAREPQNVTLVSRMALYSVRVGERAKALALTQRAIALAPNNATVQFRAAMVYELCEKRDLALDAIAKALKQGYPKNLIESEPDLLALRRSPHYPK